MAITISIKGLKRLLETMPADQNIMLSGRGGTDFQPVIDFAHVSEDIIMGSSFLLMVSPQPLDCQTSIILLHSGCSRLNRNMRHIRAGCVKSERLVLLNRNL